MRVMQYRVELDEDSGYIISNVEPELCGGINHVQVYGPGIKMTILDSTPRSTKRLLKRFKFRDDNWDNPTFRECYRRVLRGDESSGWKLVAVKVYLGYLWLEFANETRNEGICELGNRDSDSPYCNESVSFALHGEEEYAKFCFEIKRPGGLETETYQIAIAENQTTVTEFINSQKQRTIDFLPPVANDVTERRECSQWVKIRCYC